MFLWGRSDLPWMAGSLAMLLSQVLTLTSTAQHCRQSSDLCSHPLSLLPSFQGWECWESHVDTASGGAGQRENL